jgi:aspartate/methionine/tyrosine aminotransferase
VQARDPYQGFDSYYTWLVEEYKRKRTLLIHALQDAGMKPIIPDGGFFIMADSSNIDFPQEYLKETTDAMPMNPMPRDWALSRWLTKEVGITCIPPSAFYRYETIHLAENLLRFAFCKSDSTILEAQNRFNKYFKK